ncbi:MAG: peptidoglycan-associated lipoprotein Pal [Acidobacteriota bacterium]|nr:peptidoglycan-associated lipoprotein Pal [Acidobacteriota bacterium]
MRVRDASFLTALCLLLVFGVTGCKSTGRIDDSSASRSATAVVTPAEPAADEGDAEPLGGEGFRENTLEGAEPAAAEVVEEEFDPSRSPLRAVFFAFDSAALGNVALRTLEENARWLSARPDARVTVEGHCDERGTTEYNLELGARRARAVRDHLTRLGVDSSRLETISYGEERPMDEGHGESAWSRNRRAEFVVEMM